MRARERLSCAVGNVFNDTYTQLLFSFEILFFMKVLELSASQAGLIVLIGELSDAAMSLISGYLGDNVNVPFLSNKIGRRKSWHLLATFLMVICVPLLFNKCFLCDGRDQSWLPLVYFGFFSALVKVCFNMVEINHLAFVTNVAENVSEFTAIVAMRTMFTFASGVYVYVIAWALLGQDSGDSLGPTHLSDFAYLSWIATGTGFLFANIFYIGTKETLKTRERKRSAYIDMNIGGLFMVAFETENQNSRKTSLIHSIVEMFVTSSNEKPGQEEEGHQDTVDHENRLRKRSLLQNFVEVLFYNDGDETDQSSSQTEIQKASQEDPQGDARKQMVLGLQKLGRDRKKSLLVRVIDGLLSRSDHSQQDLSIDSIEDQVAVDVVNKEYAIGESWRQEGIQDIQREDNWGNKTIVDSVKREIEIDEEEKPTSVSAKCRQRRNGVVSSTSVGQLGLPNFGFEDERCEEKGEECSSHISGQRRQKKSVTFSSSELPVVPLMKGDGGRDFKLDACDEELPNVTERSREEDKENESVKNGCNPSASEDKQEVLRLPGQSSTVHPAKKRRPKTIKNWLRDPNLYKVAIIFACAGLVRNTVYSYLPLYLIERLQFAKEAIAYFPLVLLISASFSSILCEKLNKKIGSKWSFLLAAFLVMGGVVWSYFQTPSTKQATYAPVIVIGFGMSVMYVMSMAFVTELIGDNKDSSGLVISIIVVMTRISSGGIVIGIQSFYPENDSDSDEAISNYVQHVFLMAPGILSLVGSLLVLCLQPSVLACKAKALKESTEIQADKDKSSPDEVTSQFSSSDTATPNVSQDVNQNTTMVVMESYPQDTKL